MRQGSDRSLLEFTLLSDGIEPSNDIVGTDQLSIALLVLGLQCSLVSLLCLDYPGALEQVWHCRSLFGPVSQASCYEGAAIRGGLLPHLLRLQGYRLLARQDRPMAGQRKECYGTDSPDVVVTTAEGRRQWTTSATDLFRSLATLAGSKQGCFRGLRLHLAAAALVGRAQLHEPAGIQELEAELGEVHAPGQRLGEEETLW
mmetsp:Transcript_72091/g.233199  ORF Transcript_72091/g.233199 Transcript_72091/m.233199 type:complete len:201 (-) Transcript_72091:580-1182(-)